MSRALRKRQSSQISVTAKAEAKDAAPAHIAAQSASEDSKTATHRASLVSAMATSHPRRLVCNELRGGLPLLTEQWRRDTELRSTRSSLISKLALRAGG